MKTCNHKSHCVPSSSLFFSEAPCKIILESSCSKILQIFMENLQWIFILDAKHSSSYLQILNYAACVLGILKQLFLGISSIDCCTQKQPLGVSMKKAVLKHFAIFTRKHLCWSLF